MISMGTTEEVAALLTLHNAIVLRTDVGMHGAVA